MYLGYFLLFIDFIFTVSPQKHLSFMKCITNLLFKSLNFEHKIVRPFIYKSKLKNTFLEGEQYNKINKFGKITAGSGYYSYLKIEMTFLRHFRAAQRRLTRI